MPELEVPDAPEDDPDSPGSEEETSAAEEETDSADAAEVEDDEEKGEGEDEGESEEGSSEKAPTPYEKLLAKYQGDPNKLADAYFEQANSAARLHERLTDIEKYIKGQTTPKVDVNAEIQQDPEYKELVQQFNTIQGRIEVLDREQTSLISEYGKSDKKVARLEGKLEAADVEAKAEVREELREARAELERVNGRIQSNRDKMERLKEKADDIRERGQRTEQKVRERVDQKRQQEEKDVEDSQWARARFAASMAQEASRYGIDTESKQFQVLFHSVKDRLSSYLSRLPKDGPGVEIPEAVQRLMSEYAEVMGLKAKFQRASKLKREATSEAPRKREAMPAGKSDVKPPKDGRWTKSYVDERAKRLLGG